MSLLLFLEDILFDNIGYILTHPGNIDYLEKLINKKARSEPEVYYINPIQIKTVQTMEQFKQDGWKRGPILPNTRFIEWIEERDIWYPKSWHIAFGLVVPNLVPHFIIMRKGATIFTPQFQLKQPRYISTQTA